MDNQTLLPLQLSPCRYCGCPIDYTLQDSRGDFVRCRNEYCAIETERFPTHEEAITAWNTRTNNDKEG